MTMTRRTFLHHTLAVGPVAMSFWFDPGSAFGAQPNAECTLPKPANPTRFIPNEPKVLTRYSAAELADPSRATQLQQFRDAVGFLRKLPASDVIGWTKQIAQHCLNCAPSNQNNIHYNWQFLPWHRGLLYFLERILRKLSNHDDLRLCYWNWESPSSRTLPAIYAPANQPLYWKNRNLAGPDWPLANADVNVQPLLAVPTFGVFGGTVTQGGPTPATFSGPHANVHNNFSPGDMAHLQYSPRDPIFYAHHCNIDRLWSSWIATGHTNANFGNARVLFYDETRTWRYVLMNDLRDETNLGYRYSSLMQPKVSPKLLRSVALTRRGARVIMPSDALAVAAKGEGPHYLIIESIKNLDKLPADAIRYGIFVGDVEAGVDTAAAKSYLGKVSRVMSGDHDHPGPLTASLDVTGKVGALATDSKGEFELSVASLDAAGNTTATGIPLDAANISLIG